jgi:hypothetical protein
LSLNLVIAKNKIKVVKILIILFNLKLFFNNIIFYYKLKVKLVSCVKTLIPLPIAYAPSSPILLLLENKFWYKKKIFYPFFS